MNPSKYAPLHQYLRSRSVHEVRLSFGEVEDVLGFALPDSARKYPAWWSNNTGTHVGVSAWRDAGWRTSRVDLGSERVTFTRDEAVRQTPDAAMVGNPAICEDELDAEPVRGLSEAARAFDEIVIAPVGLSRSALAMVDDLAEEMGADRGLAIASILEACASERRRRMLDDLPVARMPAGHDSTVLIREDRDSR